MKRGVLMWLDNDGSKTMHIEVKLAQRRVIVLDSDTLCSSNHAWNGKMSCSEVSYKCVCADCHADAKKHLDIYICVEFSYQTNANHWNNQDTQIKTDTTEKNHLHMRAQNNQLVKKQ